MGIKQVTPTTRIYILCHAICILVGFLVVATFASNPLWFSVGASLIAAGMSGWVILVYVIATDNVRHRLEVLTEFGIINAFDARSVVIKPEYRDRVARARDRIDVMGFGLSALREDFGQEFTKWKQRAKVRILLLDPEFPDSNYSFAAQRDKEEGKESGDIAKDVKQFAREVGPLATQQGPLQIRLYKCLPTLNIFRIDDELFWGPYLMQEQSRNCPTFLVARGGTLYERLSKHFDDIWKSPEFSRNIPTEWLPGKP